MVKAMASSPRTEYSGWLAAVRPASDKARRQFAGASNQPSALGKSLKSIGDKGDRFGIQVSFLRMKVANSSAIFATS